MVRYVSVFKPRPVRLGGRLTTSIDSTRVDGSCARACNENMLKLSEPQNRIRRGCIDCCVE